MHARDDWTQDPRNKQITAKQNPLPTTPADLVSLVLCYSLPKVRTDARGPDAASLRLLEGKTIAALIRCDAGCEHRLLSLSVTGTDVTRDDDEGSCCCTRFGIWTRNKDSFSLPASTPACF